MVKFVVLIKLQDGVDEDKFWKFWHEVYGPPHLVPGLIKYCVNRVTRVVNGESGIWGMAEQWFENEEAMQAMLNLPKLQQARAEFDKLPEGGFDARTTDHQVFIMEEKIIVEDGELVKK